MKQGDVELPYSEFSDPRLVAIYDTVCPIAGYESFYLDLAEQLSATTIIDIGCGTGLLTYELAKRGHNVIGVEPAPAMLERARRRSYDRPVRWIAGHATNLGEEQADLAIMTGHVAQFFLAEESWQAALSAIHRALGPGGHLAFESRNPLVQPWSESGAKPKVDWPSPTSRRKVVDPVAGPIEWWTEIERASSDRVRYRLCYRFTRSGDELVSVNELVFRTRAEISQSLAEAGFLVEHVYGDWDRRPATPETRELIFVARRA